MGKIFKLTFLMIVPFTIISCVTDQNGFSNALDESNDNQPNASAREAIKNLTRNGKTLPSADELSRTVSNPGDICLECAEYRAAVQLNAGAEKNTGNGSDPKYQTSLKNYPRPSRGCIPVAKVSLQEAQTAMASQNLTTDSANEMEQRTMGAALIRIQQLNGGPLKEGKWNGSRPYPFRIRSGVDSSAQRADHILIKKSYSLSVAQYAHEYAHLIGNQGAYGAYSKFMGGVGYCMVSMYADNSSGEQFAEAFTAFVTEPSILLNNSRSPKACKRAYDFFRGWFKNGEKVKDCM